MTIQLCKSFKNFNVCLIAKFILFLNVFITTRINIKLITAYFNLFVFLESWRYFDQDYYICLKKWVYALYTMKYTFNIIDFVICHSAIPRCLLYLSLNHSLPLLSQIVNDSGNIDLHFTLSEIDYEIVTN